MNKAIVRSMFPLVLNLCRAIVFYLGARVKLCKSSATPLIVHDAAHVVRITAFKSSTYVILPVRAISGTGEPFTVTGGSARLVLEQHLGEG